MRDGDIKHQGWRKDQQEKSLTNAELGEMIRMLEWTKHVYIVVEFCSGYKTVDEFSDYVPATSDRSSIRCPKREFKLAKITAIVLVASDKTFEEFCDEVRRA